MSDNTLALDPDSRDDAARTLEEILERAELNELRSWLDDRPAHRVADEMARVGPVGAAITFRLLDKERALEVFEELDWENQQHILEGLRDKEFRDLVEDMDPDDRVEFLQEAPAKVAQRVLGGLSPGERGMTAALLGYPERSVGRRMTPEMVVLPANLTAKQALGRIRARGHDAETIYTLPVIEGGRRLIGVVDLRDLVLSAPKVRVVDLITSDLVTVQATDSAEKAARLMQETNQLNLPVVDSEGRLVGLFTYDDADEVIEEADSEDIARQAGTTHWTGHYMAAGVWRLARYRATWLSLLLVAATLTVSVTRVFEATLEQVAALALFIPMLIGAGGNAGAQAATACVRALAVGEVRGSDLFLVIWRESRVGLLLGGMLAILGMIVATVIADFHIAVVIGISLIVICSWAATVGGTMPLIAKKLRIDPAVVSAPMVTTLVDATGLIIYFLTAKVVLGV